MMKKIGLFLFCIFSFSTITFSQVGINTVNPKSNTDLTLGSTDKGFLPNKVTLTSTTSVTPLTGTVESGTIVYHVPNASVSGSTDLGEGLYYWDGKKWTRFTTTVAKQQDTKLLSFKITGDSETTDAIVLPYISSAYSSTSLGAELTSLASTFQVDRDGIVYISSVLYAKLFMQATFQYAYAGNTFFRIRVTNTADNSFTDFIAGCTPVSTAQSANPATITTGNASSINITANNNPAVAMAQGSLPVLANVQYSVKVYGLEGWVQDGQRDPGGNLSKNQGYVTAGTYMWGNFKLYSTLKLDYISVAY